MRQRTISAALLALLLACPILSWGQGKVGVINLQEAIALTGEGKKAFSDLQKKFQPRQQDLQRQQQEIQALQDQIQKQQATLSDEERFRLSRELEDKSKLFKRANEDATADFNAESQDTLRRLGSKMVKLLADYAQQNGFTIIFEEQQLQPYFSSPDSVLTEVISKRYDAAYPLEGAAAAPAAPAPPAPKPAAPAAKPK
ncbi:MAG: OmpH family outer membrane protein [Acidobacteria bacterium]|nr:OmpH family outer membrane protein [Acidobacteriota bacterium]